MEKRGILKLAQLKNLKILEKSMAEMSISLKVIKISRSLEVDIEEYWEK